MTFAEKAMLHQVHPAKLAADNGAAAVSLYFFWAHQLWLGLITHFAPPVIASALQLRYARLDGYRASSIGPLSQTLHEARGRGRLLRRRPRYLRAPARMTLFPA